MTSSEGARATFAGYPACAGAELAKARIGILGAEHGTLYPGRQVSHTAGTPSALRAALKGFAANRDHYDFDLEGFPPVDVVDCGDVYGQPQESMANRERITMAVRTLLERNVVPLVIGGDDSIPIPVLHAFSEQGPLSIIQVDAHIDWRDERDGEKFGYSSPMRRASEMPWVERIVQVGIRGTGSARNEEVDAARKWGAHLVRAAEVHRQGIGPVLDLIPQGARFVTLDCDGLDPSIMPAVIAPAPGGLSYWHVVELLRALQRKHPSSASTSWSSCRAATRSGMLR
jgi:agmatinase